jgi:excinuclease ABC subunit B
MTSDFHRGTFRVRGDVIDIFPPSTPSTRFVSHFLMMKLKALQFFDPLTGHLLHKALRFTVFPASHYVTPRDTVVRAIEAIKDRVA